MLNVSAYYKNFLAVDFRAYRRLLREKRGTRDLAGEAEEAHDPPAESEDMFGNQQRSFNENNSKNNSSEYCLAILNSTCLFGVLYL